MKRFQEYINEHRQINEGLFGDIVRKLLDTSLSWVEKSVAWMANSFKEAMGIGYNDLKRYNINKIIKDFNDESGLNIKVPKNENEYTAYFGEAIGKAKNAEEKQRILDVLRSAIEKNTNKDIANSQYVTMAYFTWQTDKNNGKLKELKREFPDLYAKEEQKYKNAQKK